MKVNKNFLRSLLNLFLITGIIILVNIISSFFFFDIDLTEDKRFTLNDATYDLIESLEEPLTIEVLLEGDFPSSFKRLQNATDNLLEKLRSRNSSINIRWIDPMSGSREENIENGEKLAKEGILPINLTNSGRGGTKKEAMLAFPYAIVRYKQKQQIVSLVERTGRYNMDYSRVEAINPSINLLEYKFANAIQKLSMNERPRMAILTGHGELNRPFTESMEIAMYQYYDYARLDLNRVTHIDTNIHVLIIPKPTRPFGDKHLFMIDQYVMNGGKVLWMIDALNMELDSLGGKGVFMPNPHPLDLNELLFNYGVRVNPNVVLDWEATPIAINVSPTPDKPQIEARKWFYHPKAYPYTRPLEAQESGNNVIQHPIVKNLDFIDTRYPSSIDTLKTMDYIKKTPLLRSSKFSKVQYPPVRISFDILDSGIERDAFNKENQDIAVLLEGKFRSYYKGRISPLMDSMLKKLGQPFRAEGKGAKMIVVSDGDIAKNVMNPKTGKAMPLGLNMYDGYQYGNQDFIMNCLEYLIDNKGIIAARNKEIKLRPLDQQKAFENIRFEAFGIELPIQKWPFINLILPLLFIVLFGFIYKWYRTKRYSS